MTRRTMRAVDLGPPGSEDPDAGTIALPRLWAVVKHAVPNLVECTLIPTLTFSVMLHFTGLVAASVSALGWAYAMLLRRWLYGKRIPGLLLLTSLGLTLRTAVLVASGNAFIYFLQPIAVTAGVGLFFLVSSRMRVPMVDRLALDFCPLTSDIASRPRVKLLFRRLTVFWAGVNLINAAVAVVLLLSQSTAVFVAVKPLSAMAITWGAVAITVLWALRVARQEGLHVGRVRLAAASLA